MYIIDLILVVWFIVVSIIVAFMICDRIVSNRPKSKFGKWWRNNIIMQVHSDDEQF